MKKSDYSYACSPYAVKILLEMAASLIEERKLHPEMDDEQWRQYVLDNTEWEKLKK